MLKQSVWRLALVMALVLLPVLGACATPTPQIVVQTQVVEKPVVQTQVVEKPVVQTQVVQQTVVVPQVQTQVVEQTAVPLKKTTVFVAYNGYWLKTFGPADPPLKVLQREVAKKYPEIQVELNLMPYDGGAMHDAYLTWFQAEESSIDLYGVSNYWMLEFAEQEWLVPLNGVVDQKIIDGLVPAYVDAFSYNGKVQCLGPWWGGIGGLYYRKDLLEAAGIKPPKTYEELVTAAKTIMKTNPDMAGWTWPARKEQVLVNRWFEYLNGYGGTYFDAGGKCVMNSDKGVAALKFMKSLLDDGITPKEALSWKEEESQVRFASGTAIFHSGRQDLTFWLGDPKQSKVVDKWGFIPNVAQPDGKSAGLFEGWCFGINKFSKNQEAATKVLEVLFDFPTMKDINLSQGPVQANKAVYTDPDVLKNNPNMAQIDAVAKSAIPPIPSPKFNDISLILQEELHSALAGTKDAKAALDDACKQIDALKK